VWFLGSVGIAHREFAIRYSISGRCSLVFVTMQIAAIGAQTKRPGGRGPLMTLLSQRDFTGSYPSAAS
jgi:hypothetical protein